MGTDCRVDNIEPQGSLSATVIATIDNIFGRIVSVPLIAFVLVVGVSIAVSKASIIDFTTDERNRNRFGRLIYHYMQHSNIYASFSQCNTQDGAVTKAGVGYRWCARPEWITQRLYNQRRLGRPIRFLFKTFRIFQ